MSDQMSCKKTALFEEHVRAGGRMVDFSGWNLPVQYSGLADEHVTCRTKAGLFDVSHMGEICVDGPDAEAFLNRLLTNNVSKANANQAQYNIMMNKNGGIVDDLVIYKRSPSSFFVVVNASNTDKDFAWMQSIHKEFGYKCDLINRSAEYSQIAIQGPKAQEILEKITSIPLSEIKTYRFREGELFLDSSKTKKCAALIGRTGYTGEDGFELYVPWSDGPALWRTLLEVGSPLGLKPCGLGARDTLRLEMKYPLYGHELSDTTNPLECGLGWVIKLDKGDFVGKTALETSLKKGLNNALVGIQMKERSIPRQGYPVVDPVTRERIGMVTSGTHSPTLQVPIAIVFVTKQFAAKGSKVAVEIRGQLHEAEVVETPFVKKQK